MSKKVDIMGEAPRRAVKFVILPFGLYFHRDLQKAKRGDIVRFNEGHRLVSMIYESSCRISIKTQLFSYLLRLCYGGTVTITSLMERWAAIAINEGYGRKGFSRDEALLVEVRDIDDEKSEKVQQ